MKKSLYYILILLLYTGTLAAQDLSESYLLVTDRGHYISGETLFYRVFARQGEAGKLSTSFYVELIDPRGHALVKSKIAMGQEGGAGQMQIPDGIASGTYYLKGYSRWMRNCGPEAFSYTSFQVYDPFNASVLIPDTTGISFGDRELDLAERHNEEDEFLKATLSNQFPATRENMELRLEHPGGGEALDLSLSVVKQDLLSHQHHYLSSCTMDISGEPRYIPETSGVSISGKAISASDGSPASYATIYLSMLGNQREFYCNYSDSTGRFYFSLPDKQGFYEMFISTHHEDYEELELLIDSDFSNEEIGLPSYPVRADSSLAAQINEMSMNAQISRQYYPQVPASVNDTIRGEVLFYGHPTVSINFEDFINLPTLSEYFTEVIPQVSLRKNRNQTRFIVNGEHPDLKIYQPLVLIDGVAIFDMDALLAVSPRLIQRVELITAPYIRSDVTFGGIISLITKNHDMGYIDLPSSGLLLKYQMLDKALPEDPIETVIDTHLPDSRNTLFWEPHIRLEKGESLELDFSTSDTPGSYELFIRGILSDGSSFVKLLPFQVN